MIKLQKHNDKLQNTKDQSHNNAQITTRSDKSQKTITNKKNSTGNQHNTYKTRKIPKHNDKSPITTTHYCLDGLTLLCVLPLWFLISHCVFWFLVLFFDLLMWILICHCVYWFLRIFWSALQGIHKNMLSSNWLIMYIRVMCNAKHENKLVCRKENSHNSMEGSALRFSPRDTRFVFHLTERVGGKTKATEWSSGTWHTGCSSTHTLTDNTSCVYFPLSTVNLSLSLSQCRTLDMLSEETTVVLCFWFKDKIGKYFVFPQFFLNKMFNLLN